MADTVALVEGTGQKIIAEKADVRERDQLRAAVERGRRRPSAGLHIVCANAGILPIKEPTCRRPSSTPWTSTSAAC